MRGDARSRARGSAALAHPNEAGAGIRSFEVASRDGLRLQGSFRPGPGGDLAIVYAHGFLSGQRVRAVPGFLDRLSALAAVFAFDFRGHGCSAGACSFGPEELWDLEAVLGQARRWGFHRLLTVGSSLGGATVLRHAALVGGVAGVASIGAFARSRPFGRPITRLALHLAYHNRPARRWIGRRFGTRVHARPGVAPDPLSLVDRIAPAPVLFIHGAWDPLISPREAHALYDRARQPKDLAMVARAGHDHALLRGAAAERIADWIDRRRIAPEAAAVRARDDRCPRQGSARA